MKKVFSFLILFFVLLLSCNAFAVIRQFKGSTTGGCADCLNSYRSDGVGSSRGTPLQEGDLSIVGNTTSGYSLWYYKANSKASASSTIVVPIDNPRKGRHTRLENAIDTTNFNNKLSSSDHTVQNALETLDAALTSYVLSGGPLGTPSSGILTNCSGLPITGIPTAIPSNGDTTHVSTADQIYDWITTTLHLMGDLADDITPQLGGDLDLNGYTITGMHSILLDGDLTGLCPPVILTHASGVDDTSTDAVFMTDSGESFTIDSMIGMIIYNITAGSSGTITANGTNTITATLSGGTAQVWNSGDAWQVGPGPLQSRTCFVVSDTSTIRHPAIVGYVGNYMVLGTAILTIDMASDSMVFTGALDIDVVTLDAGDSIDSSGSTTDDFISIWNLSATAAKGLGKQGTWADGGAN